MKDDKLTVELSEFSNSNVAKSFEDSSTFEKANNTQEYSKVIVLCEDSVLFLCKNKEGHPLLADKCSLPATTILAGESDLDAACRALYEDTMIDCSGQLTKIGKVETCTYYFMYCNDIDTQIVLNSDEHDNYKWMSRSDIAQTDSEHFVMDLKEKLCKLLYIEC
jgi:hypothetical protein